MTTTRPKAEQFIKELQKSAQELREKFGIDEKDVVVNASVEIHEQVRFSSVEDMD